MSDKIDFVPDSKIDFVPDEPSKKMAPVNFTPEKVPESALMNAVDVINTLGGEFAKGLSFGYDDKAPFDEPKKHPIAADIGDIGGSMAAYALPMGLAGSGTRLALESAPAAARGIAALGAESAASGLLSGGVQKGGNLQSGLASAAFVPLGAGAGKVVEKTGALLSRLSPEEHIDRLFKVLNVPLKRNHPNIAENAEAFKQIQSSPAKNATAFQNMIGNMYKSQKNRVSKIFNNNVFGYLDSMSHSHPESGIPPVSLSVNPDNTVDAMKHMDEINGWDGKAKLRSLKSDIDAWMNGPRNIREAHFLKGKVQGTAAELNRSADSDDRFVGGQLGKVGNALKADVIEHINQIDPNVAKLYRAASADWQKNVLPYEQLPQKVLSGEEANPAGFSKYFANPALQITDAPADRTSMLNILAHNDNDELPRRIILDVLHKKTEKTPNSIVNAYKDAVAAPFEAYSRKIPDIHNEFADVAQKLKRKPIIGKHATQIGLGVLGAGGIMHGVAEGAIPLALALGATVPGSANIARMAAKAAGKSLEKGGRGMQSLPAKSLLAALGGNL